MTGATGQLGRLIVEGLCRTKQPAEIGISVRHPEQAEEFKQRGMRVCQGDFCDPASLQQAFYGAEQVLIVSVNKFGEEAVEQHRNAIDGAKQAGAKRILYTSHQGASASSAFVPARDHAATEALLQASGVPFVSLRNGFYAESALHQLGSLRATGKISLPEDGPVCWTARADLAEAAVAALTEPGLFDGLSPALTAAEELDFADIARMASTILGREIVRETVGDEEYRAALRAHGVPAVMAAALGTLYEASRAREFAAIDPALGRLLGRKPTSMGAVLHSFLQKTEDESEVEPKDESEDRAAHG